MRAKFLQLSTTFEKKEDARALAKHLVEAKLAACVQILGPVESLYIWKRKTEAASEWLCLVKILAANYARVEAEILARHPYETPEIVAVPIEAGSAAYLAWMEGAGT